MSQFTMRMTDNRPVMTREQMLSLGKLVLRYTTADYVSVYLEHTARTITRLANGQILNSDDGDQIYIGLVTKFGGRNGIYVKTNQVDENSLKEMVQRCETIALSQAGSDERFADMRNVQDSYIPVNLWHNSTVQAMQDSRATVLPALLKGVSQSGMHAAGMIGLMARSKGYVGDTGIMAFYDETDSEVAITARTLDGKSSGWAGQAHRDWSKIDVQSIASRAVDIAKRWVGAYAIEPGRRTAILTPEATASVCRYFAKQFNASTTIGGQNTIFSKPPRKAKYHERVFDNRITMSSDPADPEGGFAPFFSSGYANIKATWVKDGILKELAYDPLFAMGEAGGRPYSEEPFSLKISGGSISTPITIEEMISRCEEGILVNRFSSVDLVHEKAMMLTGVTRDGCFLIKNGKINRPVRNFRFLDSPSFMLNSIIALGESRRVAYGYTPPGHNEGVANTWPRRPIIVPAMMVRDFNFSQLADAV